MKPGIRPWTASLLVIAACGTDRATGDCAVGRVECIDEGRQCPDFCTGIAGSLRLACADGRCVLRQKAGAP